MWSVGWHYSVGTNVSSVGWCCTVWTPCLFCHDVTLWGPFTTCFLWFVDVFLFNTQLAVVKCENYKDKILSWILELWVRFWLDNQYHKVTQQQCHEWLLTHCQSARQPVPHSDSATTSEVNGHCQSTWHQYHVVTRQQHREWMVTISISLLDTSTTK